MGIVDGTPVVLSQRPAVDGEVFWTRKSQYAFNLQLVVDDRKAIIYYQIGWPGSVFDNTVFDKSKLMMNPHVYFTPGEYLLADSGYAIKPHLITPYKQPHANLPHNRLFNELFSSARCLVEHANGILKNRFASLKGIRTQIKTKADFEVINKHVLICLILHNLMLQFNDEWLEEDVDVGNLNGIVERATKTTHVSGIDKRIEIQNALLSHHILHL